MATATAIPTDLQTAQAAVTRVWSEQQEQFFDFVLDERGNAVLVAVAGSGKTSTVIESIVRLVHSNSKAKVLYLVFGKKAQLDAEARFEAAGISATWREDATGRRIPPQVEVKTFHAKGWQIWRTTNPGCKIEENEGDKLRLAFDELQVPENFRGFVARAARLAKQNLIGIKRQFNDQDAWIDLIDHYDLRNTLIEEGTDASEMDETMLEDLVRQGVNWAVRVIKHGINIAAKLIDFEDMLYMTLLRKPATFQYSYVFIDEMQDANFARIEFVRYIMWLRGGRSFWVGDPRQAIYGFAGASAKAVETIKREFRARELPLTWSFRCPKLAVKRAQEVVSHIQAHPDAPEGEELFIEQAELFGHALTPEDAILCRNTAPLVELFWECLKRNIPAHVEGKEIGERLVKLVNRWRRVKTIDGLLSKLEEYRGKQVARALAAKQEATAEGITDAVDALLMIIQALPPDTTLDALKARIGEMFQNSNGDKKPTLTLCTIHKSKGLEWRWVYILGANRYQPSKYARQEWQLEQEDNLTYVARTRTKWGLVHVKVPVLDRRRQTT